MCYQHVKNPVGLGVRVNNFCNTIQLELMYKLRQNSKKFLIVAMSNKLEFSQDLRY